MVGAGWCLVFRLFSAVLWVFYLDSYDRGVFSVQCGV